MYFEGHLLQMVLPGIHHVMARAIKDILQIQNSKGYQVKRKAGWDLVYL
jgi:isoleucyl-tRNA synthetase